MGVTVVHDFQEGNENHQSITHIKLNDSMLFFEMFGNNSLLSFDGRVNFFFIYFSILIWFAHETFHIVWIGQTISSKYES